MQRNQSGQVLIVLFGSLLIGGSGLAAGLFLTGKTSSEIRKDALTVVADEDRRDAIKAVLERWEKEVKRMDKARNKNIDKLIAMLQRHDATTADFDPLFAQFDAGEVEAFDTALAMRFALRAQLSAEEWRKLFPSSANANKDAVPILDPGVGRPHQSSQSSETLPLAISVKSTSLT